MPRYKEAEREQVRGETRQLLIEAAIKDPASPGGAAYLAGYDGLVHPLDLAYLLGRLVLSLYLLASALARFDHKRLPYWEVALRLFLSAVAMHGNPAIHGPAILVSLLWIGAHIVRFRNAQRVIVK